MFKLRRFAITIAIVCALTGCNFGPKSLGLSLSGNVLSVDIKNETSAPFTFYGRTLAIGEAQRLTTHLEANGSPESSFEISRGGVAVVRIRYRVLKYWPDTMVATIVVTEPSAGRFSAFTKEVDSLRILSVESL